MPTTGTVSFQFPDTHKLHGPNKTLFCNDTPIIIQLFSLPYRLKKKKSIIMVRSLSHFGNSNVCFEGGGRGRCGAKMAIARGKYFRRQNKRELEAATSTSIVD
jgi:hypothetical protein